MYKKIINEMLRGTVFRNPMFISIIISLLIMGVVVLLPSVAAVYETSTTYEDPDNDENSITFYPDSDNENIGTFYINQANGPELDGTYIETVKSYGIKYTGSPFGETLPKTTNGILVPDRKRTEEWIKA
jgi:hypothetical protein